MTALSAVPIVGVSACRRTFEVFPGHWVTEQYMEAVVETAGCGTIIVPAMANRGFSAAVVGSILDRLDGLLLTGSPSNVVPDYYGAAPFDGDLNDPDRDATVLPIVRGAVERGIPVLAICRGIQELNVAMGGTLHQKLHAVNGRIDHRSDKTRPKTGRVDPRHDISVLPGTLLHDITGETRFRVNSLHAQGIDRLAPGARVNATADDSTIEAIDFPDSAGFALGVQWHPEWTHRSDPVSTSLFASFGNAVREAAGMMAPPAVPAAAE